MTSDDRLQPAMPLARARESARQPDPFGLPDAWTILERADIVVYSASPDCSVINFINAAAERLYGLSPKAFSEHPGAWLGPIVPDDRALVEAAIASLPIMGQYDLEYRIHRPNGTVAWVRDRGRLTFERPGHPLRIDGVVWEITDRKDAEARLRDSEMLNRAIVETDPDGIIVIDERGLIEAFNAAAVRLFGYEPAEVLGRNVSMLMPQPDRDRHDEYIRNFVTTRVRKVIGTGREVEGRRKDGRTFPMKLFVCELLVDGHRRFTGIVEDLTARRQSDTALRRQAGLAQIGQMATVVAHEVRNPLAAIRGAVDVIRTRFPDTATEHHVLGEVINRVDSLNDLVQDILEFARPLPLALTQTGIRVLVEQSVEFLKNDPTHANLSVSVDGPEILLTADPAVITRVLVNLLTNAAQAMNGHGVLHVTIVREQGTCVVTLDDTGPGIAPETLSRIFEPFFTTKTRGTGLGLAIARRAVEEHGGLLYVMSTVGVGTRARIELPIASSVHARAAHAP